MDAGIAAVCGALAGSVATIGAALATGWSQREGARIAARAEHVRQRREPRYATYKELIAATDEMRTTFRPFGQGGLGEIPPMNLSLVTSDVLNAANEHGERVKRAWLDTQLAGPRNVSVVATHIQDCATTIRAMVISLRAANELVSGGHQLPPGSHMEELWRLLSVAVRDLSKLLGDFTRAAQSALDHNGAEDA